MAIVAGMAAGMAVVTTPAAAETLTCDLFKARLNEALGSIGVAVKSPLTFTPAPSKAGKRYAWSGPDGLAGRLTCAQDDAFADFYMTRDGVMRDQDAADADPTFHTFQSFSAASVCALTSGTPDDCRAMANKMIEDGLDDFADVPEGARRQALQDYDFADDLDAVFYVTPTAVSWAIGPGLYKSVNAERPDLEPHDRDDDAD